MNVLIDLVPSLVACQEQIHSYQSPPSWESAAASGPHSAIDFASFGNNSQIAFLWHSHNAALLLIMLYGMAGQTSNGCGDSLHVLSQRFVFTLTSLQQWCLAMLATCWTWTKNVRRFVHKQSTKVQSVLFQEYTDCTSYCYRCRHVLQKYVSYMWPGNADGYKTWWYVSNDFLWVRLSKK